MLKLYLYIGPDSLQIPSHSPEPRKWLFWVSHASLSESHAFHNICDEIRCQVLWVNCGLTLKWSWKNERGRKKKSKRGREGRRGRETERDLVFAKHTSERSSALSTREGVYLHRCNVAGPSEIRSTGSDFTTSGPAAVITSLIACFPQGSSHYSGALPPNSISLKAGGGGVGWGGEATERDARSLVSVAT